MKCKKIWRNPSRITYSFGFPRFTNISEYVHLSTSVSRVFLNIRACSSAIQENFHTFLTVGRVCNMVLEPRKPEKKPQPENSGLDRVSLNKISGFSGHKWENPKNSGQVSGILGLALLLFRILHSVQAEESGLTVTA